MPQRQTSWSAGRGPARSPQPQPLCEGKARPAHRNRALALSKNPDLSRAFYVPAERGDSHASFHVRNLEPNLYYYYAVDVSGVRDLQNRGRFRTYPSGPTSFNFAFASCARTASSHPVFQTILQNTPLFFLHVGDFHYLDIKQNNRDAFRRGVRSRPRLAHAIRALSQRPIYLCGRPRLRRQRQ